MKKKKIHIFNRLTLEMVKLVEDPANCQTFMNVGIRIFWWFCTLMIFDHFDFWSSVISTTAVVYKQIRNCKMVAKEYAIKMLPFHIKLKIGILSVYPEMSS